jgi:hypothetical protein
MEKLRAADLPDSEWKANSFVLGLRIRQALVKYLESHFPQVFRKALPQTEQFAKIYDVIPSSQHREMLAKLSAFNYFNESLLRELSPTTADELIRLTSQNPEYFENTGSNFRLKNEVRQIVENFIKITGFTIPPEDRVKITSAWEARRKKIMESMSSSEVKIKQSGETLSVLQVQIKQLSENIDGELNRLSRRKRSAQRKDQAAAKDQGSDSKLQISRVVMMIVGFAALYLSILFHSKTSVIYAAVGFGLMIAALFVKSSMLTTVKAVVPTVTNTPAEAAGSDNKNLHFLNIKRGQLESKQNLVASVIAREKSALKVFDKQLREPYS